MRSSEQSVGHALQELMTRSHQHLLGPLDSVFMYLRLRGGRIMPIYLLAVVPLVVVMLMVINSISARHRAALPEVCWLLVGAIVWRWVGLAWLQKKVQEDLRRESVMPLWKRLPSILMVRLICLTITVLFPTMLSGAGITADSGLWILFLLLIMGVPGYFAFFCSSMASPALLEQPGNTLSVLRKPLDWIYSSFTRLIRLSMAMLFGTLLLYLMILGTKWFLLLMILPSLLGLDTTDMTLTLSSYASELMLLLVVFMLFDYFWAIGAVLLFYDLQAREQGGDLRQRIVLLQEDQAA